MSDKERYVIEALQKAIISAVTASISSTLPIRMLGRTINPPSDGKWLEVLHIPNNTDRTWGDERLYQGMVRLILHWPIDDKGVYNPMDIMTSINGYFTKGKKLTDTGNNVQVTIIRSPTFMGLIEQAPEILFPYSMRYHCYIS